MNIFKVLSNGDGSINEPNVSAFLGYLLDPNADHGLNNLLLIKFLKNFVDSEFNINDYSYQFMYEQAFRKGKEKKDIVDIIIMCSYQEFGNKKESQLLHVLEQKNNKQRNKIIIIENKIKGNPTEGQLQNQYEKSIAEFEERESIKIKKEDILSLYVTPDSEKFRNEFEEFYKESEQGGHVIWNHKNEDYNEDNQSIKEMLIEIIDEDSKCKIDPINELTKHYIKSFIQFIDSGFKSEVQEEKDKKQKSVDTLNKEKENIETKVKERLLLIKDYLINRNSNLTGLISDVNFTDVRFPSIDVFNNNVLISIRAGFTGNEDVNFYFYQDKKNTLSKYNFEKIANYLGVTIKNSGKPRAYFVTTSMNVKSSINNHDEIFERLQIIIEEVNSILK